MTTFREVVDLDLRPFQWDLVKYLYRETSVLIGDDMGLGKTFEACALDQVRRFTTKTPRPKTLVIAPLSVLGTWEYHLAIANRTFVTIDRKARVATWKQFVKSDADVCIVHWDALRLMPELLKVKWLHVIADECHRAANRKAQQTHALKDIPTIYKTGLSGTPATSRPDQLWSILNWLYPSQFRSYWQFFRNYVDYEVVYPQGYQKIKGPKNVPDLHRRIEPFYLRRLKEEVAKELPEKYFRDPPIWVTLGPQQRKAYDEMRKTQIAWVRDQEGREQPIVAPVVLTMLVRLQQFALAYATLDDDGRVRLTEPSAKLDALMETIEDTEEPVVIFTASKQMANLVGARMAKAKLPHRLLTGDVDQADRVAYISEFQEGKLRAFVGTIQAGGVGITLHRASTVIFLDRHWSPALNRQAEDRLHRIGQKNSVEVIDIMARNTVDLGRNQQIEQRWTWIRQLLGDIAA